MLLSKLHSNTFIRMLLFLIAFFTSGYKMYRTMAFVSIKFQNDLIMQFQKYFSSLKKFSVFTDVNSHFAFKLLFALLMPAFVDTTNRKRYQNFNNNFPIFSFFIKCRNMKWQTAHVHNTSNTLVTATEFFCLLKLLLWAMATICTAELPV
jgi:hypothetical protein